MSKCSKWAVKSPLNRYCSLIYRVTRKMEESPEVTTDAEEVSSCESEGSCQCSSNGKDSLIGDYCPPLRPQQNFDSVVDDGGATLDVSRQTEDSEHDKQRTE